MKQAEVFGNALWVGMENADPKQYLFLRGKFYVKGIQNAQLRVLGLGYFHCYINGVRVGDDLFLPLNTDYEARRDYPVNEVLNSHRVYVPEYDVTHLLKDGENVITIHFGGGWYANSNAKKAFGAPKAIWRIWGADGNGAFDFGSSQRDRLLPSFASHENFTKDERHDYRLGNVENATARDAEDSAWAGADAVKPLDTEYLFTDCPADGVCEVLKVTEIGKCAAGAVYDCGKNISGYPVIKLQGKAGDTVKVTLSEQLEEDGAPSERFGHGQCFTVICDGEERLVHLEFIWFGFRYFSIEGPAVATSAHLVHTKAEVTSHFASDNDLLNWIHDTFVHTQLTNMHGGIPSDCPHIERRGYTGDGQLVCHAAMSVLDGEAFYRKWIGDIVDCQDTLTGHIQYTAPYIHSGGGPGGWGCAIVEVPYQFYKHYGDASVLRDCYPNMVRYFDYLEAHSEHDLVVSDREG
ncbi:MAG: family 78 glycoside hydrolase catalytic domain, partial [Clostridia bacterium]|nr:family 78 glycoside hydrolase catalytic domain [Clostridia bacterium]